MDLKSVLLGGSPVAPWWIPVVGRDVFFMAAARVKLRSAGHERPRAPHPRCDLSEPLFPLRFPDAHRLSQPGCRRLWRQSSGRPSRSASMTSTAASPSSSAIRAQRSRLCKAQRLDYDFCLTQVCLQLNPIIGIPDNAIQNF